MAVISKNKYLKDIAAALQRGRMYFEKNDRPSFMMGGFKAFVHDVWFDFDSGEINYNICNSNGEVFASAHGVRCLSELDAPTLAAVSKVVKEYHQMALKRQDSLERISSRVKDYNMRPAYSI